MRALVIAAALVLTPAAADAGTLLNAAKRYVGLHERSNNATLRKVIGVNPARTKWCGYFMGAIAKKAGMKLPSGYPKAISWRKVGKAVSLKTARPGDIVVMRSHVTVYSGRKGGRICGIGGNQSNRVQESCYSPARVVAVRRVN